MATVVVKKRANASVLNEAILGSLNAKSWVTRAALVGLVAHAIPRKRALEFGNQVYSARNKTDKEKIAIGKDRAVMLACISLKQRGFLVQQGRGEENAAYKLPGKGGK